MLADRPMQETGGTVWRCQPVVKTSDVCASNSSMRANMRDSRRMNSAENVKAPTTKTTYIMVLSCHVTALVRQNVDLDWCFAHRAGTPMMQSFIVLTAQRHTSAGRGWPIQQGGRTFR
jgi:hypothetical protein